MARRARLAIESKKGENILLLDVRGLSEITDFFLLVSASSPPHLKAMANEVQVALKKDGFPCYRRAGTPESGWIVLDYVDLVIHILSAEARDYYEIESLWAQAPRAS